VKRRPTGQAANVAASATATNCPQPLVPLATERHREVFAAILGALPADQRSLPSVRAVAASAAGQVLAIDQLQRAIEAHGAMLNGKPHPVLNALATANAALIAAMRALRSLPSLDRRTIASAAKHERAIRGGRDLTAPPLSRVEGGEIDWVAIEAARRGEQGHSQ
jgi:hypothetical protein